MWTNEDFPVVENVEVHRRHCCLKHGCKYGDRDCPVACGAVKQDHPCEWCEDDDFVSRIGKYPTAPQLKRLVLALWRGEHLTPYTALKQCGTMRLSERMRELQALGWGIQKQLVKTESGAHVMSYWL